MKPKRRADKRSSGRVALNRALSKLGILSRARAVEAIRGGRIRVDGRLVTDPAVMVVPEHANITVNGDLRQRGRWRTILLHKPRGVVTTSRDPEGRPTVYDVLGGAGRGLIAVGRLDLATSGLLLMTNDTQLANWITSPINAVPRVYVATARGKLDQSDVVSLTSGIETDAGHLRAHSVELRKTSSRESHLTVELREGRNREIRRLFKAIGHEIVRLKRVGLGELELGSLAPGEWRELSHADVAAGFPGAPIKGPAR
jgi:pseudouridine synthase